MFCNNFSRYFNRRISFVFEWRRYAWIAQSIKVHPHGTEALKKTKQSIGRSRGRLTTKIHMVTASDCSAVAFSLSPGNAGDGLEGRKRLNFTAANPAHCYLIMAEPMKAMRLAHWPLLWGIFQWPRPKQIGKNRVSTLKNI